MIYPHLLCDDNNLYRDKTCLAPQWRKMVRTLIDSGVEVVDVYQRFKEWSDAYGSDKMLFTKDHNISYEGTRLVAEILSEYLNMTCEPLSPNLKVQRERVSLFENGYISEQTSAAYLNLIDNAGRKEVYRNQLSESDIAIFGDCNLQYGENIGAGISANLAYDLQHSISNLGRVLLYDDYHEPGNKMSTRLLSNLSNYKIVIYVAFTSASFVRTSAPQMEYSKLIIPWLIRHREYKHYNWCSINLELKNI